MIPEILSHYRVREKIGAGGMGVVYLAHDEQLARDVALKVLPAGMLADENARRRFRKEALALARLNHPNIGAVYEFGSQSGYDFLVMELVSGLTLDAKLAGGPLPQPDVLRLGRELAAALEAAHAQGIVHRDLKPGNLRLTSDGRLKVLDFGLADWQQPGEEEGMTATSTMTQVSGTVPYMAPEQLRGQRVDQRTDIYAAGVVLYEMAAGKRPFEGASGPQLISAILEKQPSPASSHNRQVSPALETILLKAMDKDPARRYQSAKELAIDLDRVSTGVQPVPVPNKPWGWIAAGLALAALGILFAGNVGGMRDRLLGKEPPSKAVAMTPIQPRRSVAVLGFKNLSGKPEEAWLSTALAEMLTTELAAGEKLRTVPGENVARMKSDLSLTDADSFGQDTLAKIRGLLGTDTVVLGSYLALGKEGGNKIRLDFRLQDAAAGETIASVSETGTESELLDLVSRTGAVLRQKLGVGGVSDAEASGVRASLPANAQAARFYSEGLAKLRVFEAMDAKSLLEQAVKADPEHGPSHAALADAWSDLGYDAKAKEQMKLALDQSAHLSREEKLFIEARYAERAHQWEKAVDTYRTLWGFFPDNLEYGLRLAAAQMAGSMGKDALNTIDSLRQLPAPAGTDARIDLAEARAASAVGDFKRSQQAAENAVRKGRTQGARLLLAQALTSEGNSLERLGQAKDATAAYAEAEALFTASGDKAGAAQAVHLTGTVLYDQGDTEGARKRYEEAFVVFKQLGNQGRGAASLNNIGNTYFEQGDLVHAKQYYQQTIDAYRAIDDKRGLAGGLGNLANVMDAMGDLQGSLKMQNAGLAAFRESGDQRGTASTLSNLGNLLVEMGDLKGAEAKYLEAIQIHDTIGHKRGTAYALYGLAESLTSQGNLAEARKRAEQSASIRRELGEQANIAASQVQLANIAMEEGRYAEAEGLARAAAAEFDKEKSNESGATTYALLALILLRENRVADGVAAAQKSADLGSHSGNRPSRFDSALATGRALAATGKNAEAAKQLEAVLAESRKYGYLGYEYEARLALGEIELKSGKTAAGKTRLATLSRDARDKGFGKIAAQAEKTLG